MALSPGTKLGPYEIVAPLGAGGMGEVYSARDTRLDRQVAVKVLPPHMAGDANLRQRFEREARAVSSLNHPHICALYDVGQQDGVHYFVMEYLEGETLAARVARGPLPLEQLMKFTLQVADALDKAHRKGVVHRDLKPGNIMLTPAGAKLLDFGLAKANPALAPGSSLTAMATRSTPITTEGTIVGTFHYMSPEQVEGRDADARSDIFSFGAVLYEMATGQRAFQGKSQLSVASAILEKEPAPISAVQPATPPALDRVIRRCLAKDPEDRWQTARDLLLELKWVSEAGSQADVAAPVAARRKSRERWGWIAAGVSTLLAVVLAVGFALRAPEPPRVIRATILPPEGATFGSAAVSPDGTKLAFVASIGGSSRLWVRQLEALTAQPLQGTEGAWSGHLFWSPDGRSIGFFADGKLKRIDAAGGPPITLCDVTEPRGGTWNQNGDILFGTIGRAVIRRVSAAGGEPRPVLSLEESRGENNQRWPYFLPDGRHFLYLSRSQTGGTTLPEATYVASLDGKVNKFLLRVSASNAIYAAGHLFFVREGTLMAQPFDPARLELTGDAFPVAEHTLENTGMSVGFFSVSREGMLAYRTGVSVSGGSLHWFDRDGKQIGSLGDQALYFVPRLSANGQRVAVDVFDQRARSPDVWIYDVQRGLRTRLTFDPAFDSDPIWSPDGTRIVFRSDRTGVSQLYIKIASGAGTEELLLETPENKWPTSWTADGKFILFTSTSPQTLRDIWALPMQGERKAFPLVQTKAIEHEAQISPDGRWIAYSSNESGRDEVFIAPFPGPGGKFQVSTNGGDRPRWRRDGKELFFLSQDDKIMAAEIRAQSDAIEIGVVRPLFQARPRRPGSVYDVTADGRRFLVNTSESEQVVSPVTLVVNWPASIKKQ